MMNTRFKLLALVSVVICPSMMVYGAPDCSKEQSAHQTLQVKLREGGKAKTINKLQSRERKAWHTWWQCQQGKTKKKTKRKSKHKSKANGVAHKKIDITPYDPSRPQAPIFTGKQPLVIKGAFSGAKQQAWLDYYQKPQKCLKPASLSVFAFCVEHAKNEQEVFHQKFNENR